MNYLGEVLGFAVPRIPVWALFCIPLAAALKYLHGLMRKRHLDSKTHTLAFALFGTVLLMPMPFGMFLALMPLGLIVWALPPSYYAEFLEWGMLSASTTFLVMLMISKRAFAAPQGIPSDGARPAGEPRL